MSKRIGTAIRCEEQRASYLNHEYAKLTSVIQQYDIESMNPCTLIVLIMKNSVVFFVFLSSYPQWFESSMTKIKSEIVKKKTDPRKNYMRQ